MFNTNRLISISFPIHLVPSPTHSFGIFFPQTVSTRFLRLYLRISFLLLTLQASVAARLCTTCPNVSPVRLSPVIPTKPASRPFDPPFIGYFSLSNRCRTRPCIINISKYLVCVPYSIGDDGDTRSRVRQRDKESRTVIRSMPSTRIRFHMCVRAHAVVAVTECYRCTTWPHDPTEWILEPIRRMILKDEMVLQIIV